MLPRDLFGVALRVLGVWFAYQALYWAFFSFLKTAGVPTNPAIAASEEKLLAAFYLLISLGLLILADHIVLLVYGPPVGAKKIAAAE